MDETRAVLRSFESKEPGRILTIRLLDNRALFIEEKIFNPQTGTWEVNQTSISSDEADRLEQLRVTIAPGIYEVEIPAAQMR